MISFLNLIVYASFIVFATICGISTIFENVLTQEEVKESQSSPLDPTLDNNNDNIVISEEICPPYCSPPPPIQELPQEH